MKKRIRLLRLVSRLLSLIISLAVFIPIAITFHIFTNTKDTYRTIPSPSSTAAALLVRQYQAGSDYAYPSPSTGYYPSTFATATYPYTSSTASPTATSLPASDSDDPTSRTPWHANTRAWPTYLYFATSLFSLILNLIILLSYTLSIRAANVVAAVNTLFDYTILLFNLAFWIVTVVIYRVEKDLNGVSDDIWGWSCSAGAQSIQELFDDVVDFNSMCDLQSGSWIAGIVQVVATFLSLATWIYVVRRWKVKKRKTTMIMSN